MRAIVCFFGFFFLQPLSSLFAAPDSQCLVNYYCLNKPVNICIHEIADICGLRFIEPGISGLMNPLLYQIDGLPIDVGVSVLVKKSTEKDVSVEINNTEKTLKIHFINDMPPNAKDISTPSELLPLNSELFNDKNDPDLALKREDVPMIPAGPNDGAAISINDFYATKQTDPPYNPREEGVIPPALPGGNPRTIEEYAIDRETKWKEDNVLDTKTIPSGLGESAPLSKQEFESRSKQYE